MKQKNDKVQLDMTYGQLLSLLLYLGNNLGNLDPAEQDLYDLIVDKVKRIMEHDLYSVYKTASSEAEREEARRKYLDSKGIPQDFRW